jgi:hypothetical protein
VPAVGFTPTVATRGGDQAVRGGAEPAAAPELPAPTGPPSPVVAGSSSGAGAAAVAAILDDVEGDDEPGPRRR